MFKFFFVYFGSVFVMSSLPVKLSAHVAALKGNIFARTVYLTFQVITVLEGAVVKGIMYRNRIHIRVVKCYF